MAIHESSPYEEGMEEYMNRGIKDVITEHPELEAILDDYDIGCGSCMVGTLSPQGHSGRSWTITRDRASNDGKDHQGDLPRNRA